MVSLVGYYVQGETPFLYTVINVVGLMLVPVCCVVCFLLTSGAFYRNVLSDPLHLMGDAAGRIAAGDLDFSLPPSPAGTKNELDALCASFEVMRGELERANRSMWRAAENRRKVNAAFAHDLRTPLTVLKGRSELLSAAASSGALDSGSVAGAAEAMQRQVTRLERYVESMRDLSALDDYRVDRRGVDLRCWFERLAADARDYVEGAGLSFDSSFTGTFPPGRCSTRGLGPRRRKRRVERGALRLLAGAPALLVGGRRADRRRRRRRRGLRRRGARAGLRGVLARRRVCGAGSRRRFRIVPFRAGTQHRRVFVREARRRAAPWRGAGGRCVGGGRLSALASDAPSDGATVGEPARPGVSRSEGPSRPSAFRRFHRIGNKI